MASLARDVVDTFSGYFRQDEEPKIMEQANQFLSWASCPYHKDFMAWLYEEADKPVQIKGSQADLIIGTSRANTFKEIRRYLQDQESRANSALDREQHG